jgi:hypothetical protein
LMAAVDAGYWDLEAFIVYCGQVPQFLGLREVSPESLE